MEEESKIKGAEILGVRRENFDDLCPKLEKWKKSAIDGYE